MVRAHYACLDIMMRQKCDCASCKHLIDKSTILDDKNAAMFLPRSRRALSPAEPQNTHTGVSLREVDGSSPVLTSLTTDARFPPPSAE